ncbi:putative E3 ubiquitin-protein ligase RING1a [Iris pallida]|uniref:E3 ubiquitin-protein ligase RING1a n=2 Tax=Iris pallida TaxID=29817 RepID=A0AAX6DPX6_IRIPA|nr:putative E3 ubiquitin-protein ligase RING1a [Iris pallida]KAJ6793840.1 putative E3 ubiquitin-protein ligase RING1a [Iris pallida]
MECLHRFCRECIDKSMRLGNNECPACRTHCASRRSLRDDPNYDALIAALYPDIDKYEEEELAFHEEEKNRNKKIQASIAETLRRQTEALGRRRTTAKATAAAFVRKSQGNYRSYGHLRGRGRNSDHGTSLPVSEDEEEEDVNGNDGKDSSSAEEPSPERRQKRRRRWRVPRSSPARTVGNTDADGEENDDMEANRICRGTSPLRAGNREMLAWGRGGVRSQSRHGNSSGSNGRSSRAARMSKLSEYLRNLEETDDEFDVHLTLLPLDEQSIPNLQRSYLCCRPTLSIDHLCQFIALQTCKKAEDIQIYVRKPQFERSEVKPCIPAAKTESDPLEDLQAVDAKESLSRLCESFISTRGDLVLVYCSRKHT